MCSVNFVLYVNDMPMVVQSTIKLFVDGTEVGLYMGPNNLSCVTRHFLLSFSVSRVTFYKNFTSSRHIL